MPIPTLPRLSASRGFLPEVDPLTHLGPEFDAWERFAARLPLWLMSDQLPAALRALPEFPTDKLTSSEQLERAMVILSFIGHAYIWGDKPTQDTLPANLARGWATVAKQLGRPPILSYASYALHNWSRLDANGPIALGNIVLNQTFWGGRDEQWFVLVHIDIEAKAGALLDALIDAIIAADANNTSNCLNALTRMAHALTAVCDVLDRMPEACDPYIYYQRVRPFIHGSKDSPGLPNGLFYEGVEAFTGGQFFRGETGAQSGIIPALDAGLGLTHSEDPLKHYLLEMRDYMPPAHRQFIEAVQAISTLRAFVRQQPSLKPNYNALIDLIHRFRHTHLTFAGAYIQKQTQSNDSNPTETGTGGTPFMRYLKKHQDETLAQKL